jgi:hypothetical protein
MIVCLAGGSRGRYRRGSMASFPKRRGTKTNGCENLTPRYGWEVCACCLVVIERETQISDPVTIPWIWNCLGDATGVADRDNIMHHVNKARTLQSWSDCHMRPDRATPSHRFHNPLTQVGIAILKRSHALWKTCHRSVHACFIVQQKVAAHPSRISACHR